MTIQKISNSILYGITSDTKPTNYPANTLFIEQDTGNIYRYSGSAWTLLIGATKTETLTGKTISSSSNTLTGVGLLASSNTWSGFNNFALTAAGGYEDTWKTTISTAGAADFFAISNNTNAANSFSPILRAQVTSTNSDQYLPALYFQGVIKVAADLSDGDAVTVFSSTRVGQAVVTARPLFIFRNGTAGTGDVVTIWPSYVDFKSNTSLKNAIVKADENPLMSGIAIDPIVKRTGAIQPVSTNATTAAGVVSQIGTLASHTATGPGTNTNTWDTTEGLLANWKTTTTANQNAGLIAPTAGIGSTRRAFATRVRIRSSVDAVASSVSRFYFGFTSNATFPTSDTPLATTDSGLIVGFKSTDTNYTIYSNDGATSVTSTAVTGPIAKNTSFHTIEINWTAGGNPVVIFDGTSQTISTDLPATTTNLFFNATVQNATAAIRTHSVRGIWIETI